MSRIGNKPISVPSGVDIKIENNIVTVKKDKLVLEQSYDPSITVKLEDNIIYVARSSEAKKQKALHGLYRSLISNMVIGVTEGFKKNLEVNGIGYRAQKNGNKLQLNLGYSHPIEMEEPEGITFDVPDNTHIIVKGADKQLVGEIAAKIRSFRKPDPYKGKGIKYDYEILRLREGKTGAKAK